MANYYSISAESASTLGKHSALRDEGSSKRTVKLHYQEYCDWDFLLETSQVVDMSLVIPHYRAQHQPVDQRLRAFVSAESFPVKLRVCRPAPRCKFYLEIQATVSNVTIWLPSDFRGHIHHSGKASFSAGFVNRIMANVSLNEETYDWVGDEVRVQTCGTVTFKMWDVHTNAPEKTHRETLKRIFNCSRKGSQPYMNWDFLLDD